jgi:hypothetical protein
MPIDNNYNRLIALQVEEINKRYIETYGNDSTVAARISATANKEGRGREIGGAILGNDHYAFTTPAAAPDWSSLYANAIHNPLLAENAGLVWKAGRWVPYSDTGMIGEKVESILVGGYTVKADTEHLKEGDEIISDEGKAYKLEGGFFWFIAIAIALAKKAAAKAAALALKLAIKAAKAAVKKAVKKKVKGKVKKKIQQKVKDRIKKEIKGELKNQVKESAKERLQRLKTGDPKVDNQGFDKIISRTQELEDLRKDPDADQTRIKQKEAAVRRAEVLAQKKGYKQYLVENRVGKDANFTQADVDKLKKEIEEKVKKEKEYTVKRAKEEVERIKQEVRDNKAEAQEGYAKAADAKQSTQSAITQKDRDIKDLKRQFERTLARKKAERDAKEDKLIQKKRDYEAAADKKLEKQRKYIKELGTPEQQKQLKETLRKEEEARKEAERKAEEARKEAERKVKEAEEARIAAEKQAELEEKQRVEDERVKKEQEAIDYKFEKKEEAHRVGNLNDLAAVPERAPPVTRTSYFGGNKKNARAEVVKKIMKEKGLKLIEASKYVKEHNLY